MAKFEIRIVTEAPSAAEAITRVVDGEYLGEWQSISVEEIDYREKESK